MLIRVISWIVNQIIHDRVGSVRTPPACFRPARGVRTGGRRGLNQRRALSERQELSDATHDFFMSFISFMSHESPQQQQSYLSEEVT